MAIGPKVKFKTIPTPMSWTDAFSEDVAEAFNIAQADSPSPPPPEFVDSCEQLDIYLTLIYTTKGDTDTIEQYTLALNETRLFYSDYKERVTAVNNYFRNEIASGNITGYWMYGFKVSPTKEVVFNLLDKKHKFQVVKKVFLNGPLKDNEFIQKKGKHNA